MWKRRVAYRLRVGAKSKELQLPIALQSDSHSARGMQSALLNAARVLNVALRFLPLFAGSRCSQKSKCKYDIPCI